MTFRKKLLTPAYSDYSMDVSEIARSADLFMDDVRHVGIAVGAAIPEGCSLRNPYSAFIVGGGMGVSDRRFDDRNWVSTRFTPR
jgi:hypothetical protein